MESSKKKCKSLTISLVKIYLITHKKKLWSCTAVQKSQIIIVVIILKKNLPVVTFGSLWQMVYYFKGNIQAIPTNHWIFNESGNNTFFPSPAILSLIPVTVQRYTCCWMMFSILWWYMIMFIHGVYDLFDIHQDFQTSSENGIYNFKNTSLQAVVLVYKHNRSFYIKALPDFFPR